MNALDQLRKIKAIQTQVPRDKVYKKLRQLLNDNPKLKKLAAMFFLDEECDDFENERQESFFITMLINYDNFYIYFYYYAEKHYN